MVVPSSQEPFMIKAADPKYKADGTFVFDKAHLVMGGLVAKDKRA